MDDEMQNQLRTITFSEERKGYDKGEVRQFLAEVADWIDGGGGDVVRRRLERIAHKSAQMLADAEDGAEALRREAEQEARAVLDGARAEADSARNSAETEAREQLRDARAEATSSREAANQYASETRAGADEYAEQTRHEAKHESDQLRDQASQEAKKTVRGAEHRAEQLVTEATRRREDVETVIRDLALKRDSVGTQVRQLARELEETVDGIKGDAEAARAASPVAEDPEPAAVKPVEETEPVEGLRAV